jgi:hypothetical protein
LEGLASVLPAHSAPDLERAVWLLGVAESIRLRISHIRPVSKRPIYESTYTTLRERLGEGRFAGAWRTGRAMPPEQAVTLALGDTEVPIWTTRFSHPE